MDAEAAATTGSTIPNLFTHTLGLFTHTLSLESELTYLLVHKNGTFYQFTLINAQVILL